MGLVTEFLALLFTAISIPSMAIATVQPVYLAGV